MYYGVFVGRMLLPINHGCGMARLFVLHVSEGDEYMLLYCSIGDSDHSRRMMITLHLVERESEENI